MVKQAFEERTVRIPDNREVRADINSVKRFVTRRATCASTPNTPTAATPTASGPWPWW